MLMNLSTVCRNLTLAVVFACLHTGTLLAEFRQQAATPDTLAPISGLGPILRWAAGPEPVVLISGLAGEAGLMGPLADALGRGHTVYAVSLPGLGGSSPLADTTAGGTWWSAVGQGVRTLVEREALADPWIVGELESGRVVFDLLATDPEAFAGGVVLNTLLGSSYMLYSPLDPVAGLPLAQRTQRLDEVLSGFAEAAASRQRDRPAELWSQTFVRSHEHVDLLAPVLAAPDPSVRRRFLRELFATEWAGLVRVLERPLLAVLSIPDPNSPFAGAGAEFFAGEWVDVAEDAVGPVRVAVLSDTRQLLSLDASQAVAQLIRTFVRDPQSGGRPPPPPAPSSLAPSGARSVSATIGATHLRVDYSSPATRGRDVFGALVPFDRMWRAGANASTRVSFDRPLRFGGALVAPGAYSLYVLPREDAAWDVALHRRSPDFGTYVFFYDPAGEVARVQARPMRAPATEYLTYDVAPTGLDQGVLALRWDTLEIEVPITASAGLGDPVDLVEWSRIRGLAWQRVAEDGDDATTPLPAARDVWLAADPLRQRLWVRVRLERPVALDRVGINVALDSDLDPETGSTWWGGNSNFRYDRVYTAWVVRSSQGYRGRIGWSDASAFAGLFPTNLNRGGLLLALEETAGEVALGLPLLEFQEMPNVRMLVAVGSDVAWSDDVPDEGGIQVRLEGLVGRFP